MTDGVNTRERKYGGLTPEIEKMGGERPSE